VSDRGIWTRLDEQLSLVTMRPRLSQDVRIRHIGEEFELVQVGTRRVLPLDASEVDVVRRFDGEQTVAEMIVAGIDDGVLAIEPVLSLVDRLVRAELLDQYPPDLYRQVVNHLDRLARASSEPGVPDASPEPATGDDRPEPQREIREDGPWRARSPKIAELARFLRGVSLLSSLDVQSIGALADAAHEEAWKPESFIVSEGGRGDRFFIVMTGEVNVQRRDDDGTPHAIARLGPGDWFGEAAIVEGAPRNATVQAGDQRVVKLLSFDADVFDRWIRPHVQMLDGRGAVLVSRRRAQLEQVPLFRALAPSDLDRLAGVLREACATKGTVLFRQGDDGDKFYVIVEGAVGVVKDGRPIAKLLAGEFFGETALLFTDERTATIAATEDSRFWVLDRSAFQRFVRDALLHRRDLMPTVLNRISSTDPV
jgi:CRP-like cAMP-binding protein/type III secretion system FlhB-like substrate exporter